MFVVEKRNAETLLPIRQRHASDEWRAYSKLEELGNKYYTVNHSKNYVDPLTKRHTQLIEQLWGVSKKRRSLFIDKSGPEIFQCFLHEMANFRDDKIFKNKNRFQCPMKF